jgi:uncharacterized membrane protein (UPF0127 family)
MREIALASKDGRVVCERCLLAEAPLARMRGLLGRRGLAPGEGLLLRPAASVHTWFMRFPIDVVFLAQDGAVLKVVPRLRPWRAASCRGAKAVVELRAGESAVRGLREGSRLEIPRRRRRLTRPATGDAASPRKMLSHFSRG